VACFREFDCEDLPFSVIIEDDDRVAYAYLLRQGEICGDVWLYNCTAAPERPEWSDPTKAPFANPQEFALANAGRITDETPVQVLWVKDKETLARAEIYQADVRLAVLAPGAKPGWCRNAKKDGPLAKVVQ
jgi:hypothetical protein